MKASMKKKRGVVGATVLAGILAVGGYALTNTITFEDDATTAGYGAQVVHKAQVTDIDYTLSTDKSTVDTIDFILKDAVKLGDAAETPHAWIRYNETSPQIGGTPTTTWVDCGPVADAATSISCDTSTTPIPVRNIGETNGTRTDWADNDTEPGSATAGGDAPLELVFAE